jgi:hypothetical protein
VEESGRCIRYYAEICQEGLRKTTKKLRTAGVWVEILTREYEAWRAIDEARLTVSEVK